MKLPAEVQLGSRTFLVRESTKPLKARYGYCRAGQEIVLSKGLNDSDKLRVFLHECLHALLWTLDEEVVDEASKELADALEIVELV